MFQLHHIGVLVDSIDAIRPTYELLCPNSIISEKILVSTQRVYACFIDIKNQITIELIEPLDSDSVVHKLKKRGITYYHLGYYTDNFDKAVEQLSELHFTQINIYNSEGFHNKRCSFFMSPEMHLIEIVEN
jgi:hypothetical protein